VRRLEAAEIIVHPFVIGELALGHLGPRRLILNTLLRMPQTIVASHDEVLNFIDQERLFGFGIGYVDAHLLAATRLTAGARLWTRDKRLRNIAENLTLAAPTPA
jgi:predicted nucleic acid-binding protein